MCGGGFGGVGQPASTSTAASSAAWRAMEQANRESMGIILQSKSPRTSS
jgi:hypothetical protein